MTKTPTAVEVLMFRCETCGGMYQGAQVSQCDCTVGADTVFTEWIAVPKATHQPKPTSGEDVRSCEEICGETDTKGNPLCCKNKTMCAVTVGLAFHHYVHVNGCLKSTGIFIEDVQNAFNAGYAAAQSNMEKN